MNSGISAPTEFEHTGNTNVLRLGLIGAGRMGLTHLSILGGHPAAQIVAVADNSTLMTRALSKFRPDIQLFDEYSDMLQRCELDAVIIATPPDQHARMIDSALDEDLSVFVEKPFVLSGADARRLTDRSASKRGTHQVGYVNRFNDMFRKAKELVESGIVGRLVSFRSDMFGSTVTQRSSGSGWRGKQAAGGGCLYEFGSHAIDLMVFLLGKPSKVMGTQLVRVFSSDVEDIVRTNVLYENGLMGSLNVNWSDLSCRKPTNRIEILGEMGKLLVDQHGLKFYLTHPVHPYVPGWNSVYITDIFSPVPFYVRGAEFTQQLFHFVEGIQNPRMPNRSSFAEATATQEVIDMILADAGGIV